MISTVFHEATIRLTLLFPLLSNTQPLPVTVPAGRWKSQRSSAPVPHPRPDLWRQQGGQPRLSPSGGPHFLDVQQPPGQRSPPARGQRHCHCRGCRQTRGQQLTVRG